MKVYKCSADESEFRYIRMKSGLIAMGEQYSKDSQDVSLASLIVEASASVPAAYFTRPKRQACPVSHPHVREMRCTAMLWNKIVPANHEHNPREREGP